MNDLLVLVYEMLGFDDDIALSRAAEMRRLIDLAQPQFDGVHPPDVEACVRAGLLGETVPIRTLGVDVSAKRVELRRVELGWDASEKNRLAIRHEIISRQFEVLFR